MTENKEIQNATMNLADALRLKHSINQEITYKGLNARQVTEAQKVGVDGWQKVRNDYSVWVKHLRLFNNWVVAIFGFVGVGLGIYLTGWLKAIGIIIAFYCFAELYKRKGHKEGYFDGYDAGMHDGVNKMLGIDDDESADIHERAIEMKIDEGVINRLDKKLK